MIESGEIWASKVHYLNDSTEFSLALALTEAELVKRRGSAQSDTERKKLDTLRRCIRTIASVNTCVASFSERGDSLSQWRAYCGGKPGFALGYPSDLLEKQAVKNHGFRLRRCVYESSAQQRIVEKLIDAWMETDFNTSEGFLDTERPRTFVALPIGGGFAANLAEHAPLLKHSAFADEAEWRLISKPLSCKLLKHRVGSSMVIPFFRLPLKDDHGDSLLREVVIGPTPHPELSEGSLQSLVSSLDLKVRPRIRVSGVPFRNW